MVEILTVTMNPALDVFTSIDKVVPSHKLRCGAVQQHPGGGGINVARVLQRLGANYLALFPAGGANGHSLCQLLDLEQVKHQCIPIQEETRESFSVHENTSDQEYRFVLPGPTLLPQEWQACMDAVEALTAAPRYLVVSGGLAPGVPVDFYARLSQWAQSRESKLVLDCTGPALLQALAVGVYLFKPNLRELCELAGRDLEQESDCLTVCRQIIQAGQAQMVALSLGAQGALLVTATQAWRAPALPVNVASAIGAGDSFVAGLVWALNRDAPLEQAFRYAMAAGTAALLRPGTALCQAEEVERFYPQITLVSVD